MSEQLHPLVGQRVHCYYWPERALPIGTGRVLQIAGDFLEIQPLTTLADEPAAPDTEPLWCNRTDFASLRVLPAAPKRPRRRPAA
ncbi:MAG TPA: hypothetical protein VK066_20095 [Chloroflexota bacterium]|nr:hypothetical protein [Chloroflexota bacterium]